MAEKSADFVSITEPDYSAGIGFASTTLFIDGLLAQEQETAELEQI